MLSEQAAFPASVGSEEDLGRGSGGRKRTTLGGLGREGEHTGGDDILSFPLLACPFLRLSVASVYPTIIHPEGEGRTDERRKEKAKMEEIETDVMPECLISFVDSGTVESHRYFLAWRTLLEMLRDRGFPIPDDDLAISLPAFRARFGENPKLEDLRISTTIPSNPPKKVPLSRSLLAS